MISDAEKAQTLISNFSAKFLHIASDRDREPNFRSPRYLDYLKKNNWKSVALGHRLSGQVPSIVNFYGSIESIRSEGLSNDDFEQPTAQLHNLANNALNGGGGLSRQHLIDGHFSASQDPESKLAHPQSDANALPQLNGDSSRVNLHDMTSSRQSLVRNESS